MATQTVEAVDHKLLVAGEWIETGEWGEVQEPLRRHRRRPGRRRATRRSSTAPPRPPTRPSSRPTSPSTSAPRCSTAPPSWSRERVEDLALTIAAEAGKPMKTAHGRGRSAASTPSPSPRSRRAS